eukprot:1667751-Rhodomonas_salina.3
MDRASRRGRFHSAEAVGQRLAEDMELGARYAKPGTDAAYGATTSCYAWHIANSPRSRADTSAMPMRLLCKVRLVFGAHDVGLPDQVPAVVLCARYAMSGTDIDDQGTMEERVVADGAWSRLYQPTRVLCGVRYRHGEFSHVRTDEACGTGTGNRMTPFTW